MCFNFDGSSAKKVTVGATSGYRMSIAVRGIASHAGVAPEMGVSAISIAALAIAELQRNGWLGLVKKGKHRGTSNIGVIHGGEATNVITDLVVLHAEARSHVPVFRERIVREIQKAFRNAVKEVKSANNKRGAVAFEGQLNYEAYRLDVSSPVVQLAIAEVAGLEIEPEIAISNGGLDANWLNAHGIPTVSLGAGQMSVHTVDEALCIPEFHNACRIALRLATAV
jgi:tripeptide aminopeptidase